MRVSCSSFTIVNRKGKLTRLTGHVMLVKFPTAKFALLRLSFGSSFLLHQLPLCVFAILAPWQASKKFDLFTFVGENPTASSSFFFLSFDFIYPLRTNPAANIQMSYNGIGLPTPRGTGTSGYIQKNAGSLNPATQSSRGVHSWRQELAQRNKHREDRFAKSNITERKVDRGLVDHARKRKIELECVRLRDELEEEGAADEVEIERRVEELRAKLRAQMEDESDIEQPSGGGGGGGSGREKFKAHQVHEMARAKELENDRFRQDVLNSRRSRSSYPVPYRDNRNRSLSPPTRGEQGVSRNGARERSPSYDRSRHVGRRRRSSVSGSPRRQSWTGGSGAARSRSRSPLRGYKGHDREDDDRRRRSSWRRSSFNGSRDRRESASPSPDEDKTMKDDSGREGSSRPRSRSPRRDWRRRGSRYGSSADVDLNYN